MQQSNPMPEIKVGNPKAYQEALSKPAPRKGQVVTMSIPAFHYYRQIHRLDVQGWNYGTLMVRKTVEKVEGAA